MIAVRWEADRSGRNEFRRWLEQRPTEIKQAAGRRLNAAQSLDGAAGNVAVANDYEVVSVKTSAATMNP